MRVQQGSECKDVASGGLFILDNSRPFELSMRPGGAFRSTVVRMGRPRWLDMRKGGLLETPSRLRLHPLHLRLRMNLAMLSRGSSLAHTAQVAFLGNSTVQLLELMHGDAAMEPLEQGQAAWHELIVLEMDRRLWDPEFSLDRLAAALRLSPRRVQRILAARGQVFSACLRERRLAVAAARLKDSKDGRSIEAIAAESGFRDLSTFYRSFKRQYGIKPGDWRKA